ncbi:unnamed protein product [Paramecium pentaurelia]|uniref:Ubiquitin carboxyl-terminal hydrolase n=1 Tax=Paramecium pentaurelia TaxID=43138 RepID=A0A8S1SVL9_9CILI|nr:unnamed protein product [Paramecium pentaurelia]
MRQNIFTNNQRPPSTIKDKMQQQVLPNYPLLLNKTQSTPTQEIKSNYPFSSYGTSTLNTLSQQASAIEYNNQKQYPSQINYQQQQSGMTTSLSTTQKTPSTISTMTQSQPEQYQQKSMINVSKGICGLRNIGNTCFMNSVLQCLLNVPAFNEHFLNGDYLKDLNSKNSSVPNEYSKLVAAIRNTPNFQSIAPYGIKSAVEIVMPCFKGYAQQDAQEFLVGLLDGLSLGLNRVKNKPLYKEMNDNLNGRTLQDLSKEWWDYSKSRENSLVLDYFQGQLLHSIKCCICSNSSYAFDTFQDTSLAFTRAFKILEDMDLDRLLDKYVIEETIDDYYCSKCKKHQKVKRKFTIWRLPHILMFHIKRFDYRRFSSDKLNHRVKFPLELDMTKFIQDSLDQSTKNCQYSLCGIVNHSGTLYGGHYTADSKNPYNQKWYRYNDSDVREIDIKQQRYDTDGSSSPYILLYARKSLY